MAIGEDNFPSGKSIGSFISEISSLDKDQINAVLVHQKKSGLKFGEAAVALGLVNKEDVLWALSQQFHYPYQSAMDRGVGSELVVAIDPFNAPAEFFRGVRSDVLSSGLISGEKRRALAVCSTSSGDGKSYFAANFAVSLSQLGSRTLLLDADMRTPRQHEIFSLGDVSHGLSNILAGRSESNVIRPIDALPNLFLMPVGVVPPNPLELVQGGAFDHLISELLRKFEYIVVDTPAMAHGSDSKVIAMKCGSSLAIARKGRTKMDALSKLVKALRVPEHFFGGIVTNEF
jgi:protein-tyrosine kinase